MENQVLLLNILALIIFIASVFSYREIKTIRIILLIAIEAIITWVLWMEEGMPIFPLLMIVFGLILIPYTPNKHIWEDDDGECKAKEQEPKN